MRATAARRRRLAVLSIAPNERCHICGDLEAALGPGSGQRRADYGPSSCCPWTGTSLLSSKQVDRVAAICGRDNVLIATGAHLADATLAAVPGLRREQLLIEPAARNTAPCLGWAAATVARKAPDAVIMALPADPHIEDDAGFVRAIETAVRKARTGVITTIGIRPSHPETGYGYLEARADTADADGVLEVERFVEEPDREHAEAFVAAGNFFWNAGMFFYRASDMLAAIRAHLPALADGLAVLDEAAAAGHEHHKLKEVFPTLPNISIDFGVMEHVAEMAMVPGEFGWSDLGSWLSAYELGDKDVANNCAPGTAVLIDAAGNHVVDMRTDQTDRVIALVGVSDLVVVQTDDGLLVMPKEQSQRVRDVVAALRSRGDASLI